MGKRLTSILLSGALLGLLSLPVEAQNASTIGKANKKAVAERKLNILDGKKFDGKPAAVNGPRRAATTSTELVELPAGATVEIWYAEGIGSKDIPTDPKVAFVGNDVYISNLFSDLPNAWVKGTIEGTTATFKSLQYLGQYVGSYDIDIWAVGSDGSSINENFTFTYDATAKTLTLDEGQYLIANASTDEVYYLAYISALTLSADAPAIEIDELPYSNDFTENTSHFKVIDANKDGSTWSFDGDVVRYTYNSNNAADDWLVSPAIMLMAGKKYHFAIDAKTGSTNYPEKFEVKAAAKSTVEALTAGATVIEEQTINNTALQTFETETLTVATTGYYHIGIHATSDTDQFRLDVDNFLIENAPISAPYSIDFTQGAGIDDFQVLDNNNDGKTWAYYTGSSGNPYAYYSFNSSKAADDYLILPIKLQGGKNYNVTITASTAKGDYPEKFEVVAGKAATAKALTTTVISEQTLTSADKAEFEGTFSTDEAGTYYVAIHATSDADQYQLRVFNFAVEERPEGVAPAAVSNFAVVPIGEDILGATITFNAPTKTINGSNLAADAITKIDIMRDGTVIKTIATPAPGSAQRYTDTDEALTIGNHKYQAVTYGKTGVGGKSEGITVFLSATLTVPYVADFNVAGTFNAFQVIDNNADGKTWAWAASYQAYYNYSSTNNGDDYLVTSPIRLEAGKSYKVTVSAKSQNDSYSERFEVVVGKEATAEALNITAISPTDVADGEYADFDGEFTVSESGSYYVAIHAISDADQWRLMVEKLAIEKGVEPTAPVAAADFTAVAGAEGALEVNIAYTAPVKAINGTNLSGRLTMKLFRDDVVIATTTATPGSAQTYKDTDVEDGKTYTYYVQAVNAAGDEGQKSEKVSVYVGQDELGDIANFAATANTATTITFAWDEVTGKNGGYVNTAVVEYTIYTMHMESNGYGYYLVKDEAVTTVTGTTTATVNFPVDEGQQNSQYFGISAKTNAENETDPTDAYTYLVVGAPEELPIFEGFAGSSLHYSWNYNGGLYISTIDSDGDGTALKIISWEDNQDIFFTLDKVNLKNTANPVLMFDVKGNLTSVAAIGSADGAAPDILGQSGVIGEYTSVKFPLSSIIGRRYSTVGLTAYFAESSHIGSYSATWGDTLIIDNIKILDLLEHNLAVSVSAPKSVQAGNMAKIKVTVLNKGENAAAGYTVTLTADGKQLFSETVSEALAFYESKEFIAELQTTIFTEGITLTATVEYANDLNLADNVAEEIITVRQSGAAPVENLVAADNNDGTVTLAWNAPTATTQEVTDDVEIYDADDNGGLSETVHTGTIGDWTVYDSNEGKYSYGFDGNGTQLGNPGSFMVFNPGTVDAELVTKYGAHSGDQYLVSACCAEPDGDIEDTDHWLISPELPGVAQTISFFVRELVTSYGAETYQILASSTNKEISSFTLVAQKNIFTNEWTEVSFDLPAGTKYFAIRHISNDVWGMMIDDITYTAGSDEVASYNVYVDEEFYGNVTETTAEVEVESGNHKFSVTAVYAKGTVSAPVSVTCDIITAIKQLIATGKPVNVYTTDGRLVRKNVTSVEGLNTGFYIVGGKKTVLK